MGILREKTGQCDWEISEGSSVPKSPKCEHGGDVGKWSHIPVTEDRAKLAGWFLAVLLPSEGWGEKEREIRVTQVSSTKYTQPSVLRRGILSPWFPPRPGGILAWCYSKVHSAKEIHSLIPFNTICKTMIFPPEKSFTISHGLEARPKRRTGSLNYQEC